MARKHIVPKSSPRGDEVRTEVVLVPAPATLLTFEEPNKEDLSRSKGAFVRIRPPANTEAATARAWKTKVEKAGARAVRLLAAPKDAHVPIASQRARIQPKAPREEVERLLTEAGDPALTSLCHHIADEVKL